MDCSTEFYNPEAVLPGDTNGDGVLSGSEQYLYQTESTKLAEQEDEGMNFQGDSSYRGSSDSTVHTGPRGGRYTITSGGNKSYIRRR